MVTDSIVLEQYPGKVEDRRKRFRLPEMDGDEWYSEIYELAPSLCMVLNPEGLIIDCNLALAKALGYTVKGELEGRSMLECADGPNKETLQKSFEIWRKTGKIHNHEFKMKRADGSTFPALINANSIHDEFGRIIACNAAILNITELVNARKKVELAMNELVHKEKELQEMNEELKRVERAKEEFVSMVSHELKNPLTPIIAFSDILKNHAASGQQFTEKHLAAIPIINQNAKEMKHLIDDLLTAYKLDMRLKFTFSETRIVELANQVVTELSPMLNEKGIKIKANILLREHNETVVTCDALRLRQVLINLIRNSVDFLPPSEGEIIITLEDKNVEQEQPIYSKSAALLISIADNGPGVPPDKVSGLFKKFYQADPKATRKHGGTGLGLAICKEIVEMHGGKIWYETTCGNGACFKFLLPRLPPTSLNDSTVS